MASSSAWLSLGRLVGQVSRQRLVLGCESRWASNSIPPIDGHNQPFSFDKQPGIRVTNERMSTQRVQR